MGRGRKGLFVALEGIDGAGKTTLLPRLARRLRREGVPIVPWHQPRDPWLVSLASRASARGETGLAASAFALDHALARGRIERKVEEGRLVLSDRSIFSTLAFQGPGLPPAERRALVATLETLAARPAFAIWLDLPVPLALRRLAERSDRRTPWENRRTLERVSREYRRLARASPRELLRLDASLSLPEVEEAALTVLRKRWRGR